MDPPLTHKRDELERIVGGLGRVVVAYSGGVDSALLASVAHDMLGDEALAVTAVSPSLARRERAAAARLASELGWAHLEVETAEVERTDYSRNDPDRCYWCKTELFEVLGPLAAERNASVLVGTNADDLSEHRPGTRAAREREVRAPLAEVGLTKREVRALASHRGLPAADKPASPCLASRVAYGVEVTREVLARIDAAEDLVRSFGFEVLRVRDHGDLARVEVPAEQIERAVSHRDAIEAGLKALGYVYVTLDLTGFRSGAMNEVLPTPGFRSHGNDAE